MSTEQAGWLVALIIGLAVTGWGYDRAMWALHGWMHGQPIFSAVWGGIGVAMVIPFIAITINIFFGAHVAGACTLIIISAYAIAAIPVVIGNVKRDTTEGK